MEFDSEGFYYPKIDSDLCIKCNACAKACHILNPIKTNNDISDRTSFYGWINNYSIRRNSSSGGIFSAISNIVLDKGGVVYGAFFDVEKRLLEHCSTEKVELSKLCKSKYIESKTDSAFKEIIEHLQNDRLVLFCGTPCQVSGLKRICQHVNCSEEKLITVDFICHGIPSALLFQNHLDSVLKRNEVLEDISFRQKEYGWESKNICIKTNKRCILRPYMFDSFYAGFLKENVFLRKSCYNCMFRRNHLSDITLADFWGYRSVSDAINDGKGLSLVIANSYKGKEIVDIVQENSTLNEIDNCFSDYVYEEKDYLGARCLRDSFYDYYFKYGFEYAAKVVYMKRLEHNYFLYKCKNVLKHLIFRG